MRRVWREHQIICILLLVLLAALSIGTLATWHEFRTNEGIGMEGVAEFWSWEFAAYWTMQLAMNFAPELLGFVAIVVLKEKFWDSFVEGRE